MVSWLVSWRVLGCMMGGDVVLFVKVIGRCDGNICVS